MEIQRAAESSLEQINEVISRSKKHWNYPEEYLKHALPLLKVDRQYLSANPCFEIVLENRIVGFFALTEKGKEKHLDHLWIAPDKIGMGLGRLACEYARNLAKMYGWSELLTYPDPPSEGFYLKQGFEDTGKRIPSRVTGGPTFSIFSKKI